MIQPSKDLSVEYAHIYTNNKIEEEHHLSLQVLGEVKKEAESQGKTLSLAILIDDYSFPDPTFNYGEFLAWLGEKGSKADVVMRESQLIPVCDEVLGLLQDQSLKSEIEEYIKEKKKYPCSLFIASWYLLRLGYISTSSFREEYTAKKLINILPSSFKDFEDKGLEIMASTSFPQSIEQVEHRYFEGRLIV